LQIAGSFSNEEAAVRAQKDMVAEKVAHSNEIIIDQAASLVAKYNFVHKNDASRQTTYLPGNVPIEMEFALNPNASKTFYNKN